MGTLIYGHGDLSVDFDDRTLAHLQMIIGTKLRRRESFLLSWSEDGQDSERRSSIWLDSSVPMYFRYTDTKMPELNHDWIALLMAGANSATGLVVTAEPVTRAETPRGQRSCPCCTRPVRRSTSAPPGRRTRSAQRPRMLSAPECSAPRMLSGRGVAPGRGGRA